VLYQGLSSSSWDNQHFFTPFISFLGLALFFLLLRELFLDIAADFILISDQQLLRNLQRLKWKEHQESLNSSYQLRFEELRKQDQSQETELSSKRIRKDNKNTIERKNNKQKRIPKDCIS